MAESNEVAPQEDVNDPDYVAAHPPEKVADPKTHFKTGANEGKWMEYDERGVPTKTIKKKKLTKKEKDALEAEFLAAKKKHQQYLQDYEAWEQQKVNAESALEKSDRLRWAFRQVGEEKSAPISVDELEDLFRVMGWDQLSRKEVSSMKKGAAEHAEDDGMLGLEALRVYTKEQMPMRLLEDRLSKSGMDGVVLEELYSPRSWRRKLEQEELPMSARMSGSSAKPKKEKKSRKGDGTERAKGERSKSPRAKLTSPRGERRSDGTKSPSQASPRSTKTGSKSPRGSGESPRARKEKKEKKEKR